MKVAYVAGPYRADNPNGIFENIMAARRVAVRLWQIGYVAICPHMNTMLFDGACDDSVWLEGDLEILRRCDLVVMVPGWSKSQGAKKERLEAKSHGIPVFYWDNDTEYDCETKLKEFLTTIVKPSEQAL